MTSSTSTAVGGSQLTSLNGNVYLVVSLSPEETVKQNNTPIFSWALITCTLIVTLAPECHRKISSATASRWTDAGRRMHDTTWTNGDSTGRSGRMA